MKDDMTPTAWAASGLGRIPGEDRTPPSRPATFPSRVIQEEITELAKIPGNGPSRIQARLRRKGHDIDLNTVRYVLVHGITA